MHEQPDIFEDVSNPLDSVEDLFFNQDWVFHRPHEDEISVTVTGRHAPYHLTFIWQDEFSAMQFICAFDFTIPNARRDAAALALQDINARLWLGHFVIQGAYNIPAFRHTSMFRGQTQTSGSQHVEDLIDIAVAACDRYFTAFDMLSCDSETPNGLFSLAVAETMGEA